MSRYHGRAFAVHWSEVERWSTDSFRSVTWSWPDTMFCRLGDVLSRRVVEVADRSDLRNVPIIEKISFGGVISVTDPDERDDYRGRLFWAEVGDLIYSKIRAKQGSLGLIQPEVGRLAVSAEYPVYTPIITKVVPSYLTLLLKCSSFLSFLDGIASGGDTKTRISPELFESLRIALPPLTTQRAIVEHWNAAQKKNAAALLAAEEHEAEVQKKLFRQLGYSTLSVKLKQKAFAITWGDLDRWSVEFHQQRGISHNPTAGKYPVRGLGDIAVVSYGIQKAPSNRPGSNPHPYLRVANVQRGALDLAVIKYINVPPNELHRFVLRPGDLLVCEGNSAELVGRPAIWNGEIENCVHQNHLLRVRVNREVVLPEYLLHWMNLPIARAHFRSRAKATTNLSSINSSDLRELPVALPPLPIQEQLVADVTAARAKIAAERAAAAKLAADTAREVEEMILGNHPVPNVI